MARPRLKSLRHVKYAYMEPVFSEDGKAKYKSKYKCPKCGNRAVIDVPTCGGGTEYHWCQNIHCGHRWVTRQG